MRADYLAAGLDRLHRDYGSISRHVSAGLGVDARTTARIHAQLPQRSGPGGSRANER